MILICNLSLLAQQIDARELWQSLVENSTVLIQPTVYESYPAQLRYRDKNKQIKQTDSNDFSWPTSEEQIVGVNLYYPWRSGSDFIALAVFK